MKTLYILFSQSANQFYTGMTSDLEERLKKHRAGAYKNAFTKKAKDWEVVLKYHCLHTKDARYLEQFIKRMKSKKFISKVINDPEILTSILQNRF
ncbi:GIY-YIG nuclease family protein [Galbibacter sp. BG1]|uniref:GIY-YIG nuclease family protein n=1 Tax=Galbibacter sp. BG1 TaxID=1170699 RepID=UPI0015BAA57D|nr:GIY-YIG nuclease family protein [Galbibacter sp. BG1]QLE00676.1 GIY-YIG nuclease family protein [Galbibacter sp. BG1]